MKNEVQLCIRFDLDKPRENAVYQILNNGGYSKKKLIVCAIEAYGSGAGTECAGSIKITNGNEASIDAITANIERQNEMLKADIRAIIKDELRIAYHSQHSKENISEQHPPEVTEPQADIPKEALDFLSGLGV